MRSLRELFGKKPIVEKPMPPSYGKRARENRQLHLQIKAAKNNLLKNDIESSQPIEVVSCIESLGKSVSDLKVIFQALERCALQIASGIDTSDNSTKQGMAQLQSRMDASDHSMKQGMAQLQSSVNTMFNGSNQAISKLQSDIDALKQDIMSKQGREQNVDAMMPLIKLYTQNAIRQKDIGDSPEIYAVQARIEVELQMMGVTMHSSSPGTAFDPHVMEVAQFEFVLTNKQEFENTVAESVVPAFRKGGATGELIQYEQVALFKYDEQATLASNCNDDILPPITIVEKVVGFLAYRYDGEIRAIYEVYEGNNVFGTNPKIIEGRHSYRIPVREGEGVEQEHFEICEDKMRLLSGTWGIDYYGNTAEKELDMENGLCVFLSEHISFVYYEK